jgi:hypothetical protein
VEEFISQLRIEAVAVAIFPRVAWLDAELLKKEPPIDEEGVLTPVLVNFAPDAKGYWVECYDEI